MDMRIYHYLVLQSQNDSFTLNARMLKGEDSMKKSTVFLFLFLTWFVLSAQDKPKPEPEMSVTKHQVRINGQNISYTATAGYMIMRNEEGEDLANVFFIAYTREGVTDISKRPVTFTFNGGPGSSSVWLHMGALGPRRVQMTDKGGSLRPPYQVVNNEFSWLDKTDLVFIDPMMTGFTRPAGEHKKDEFTGFENDINLVGDFIYQYTGSYNRWSSPKFLCGESYGTTRAAGLSGYLQNRHGMYLNGIMMISAIMNFQASRFNPGNDLPYPLYLPTFAATAWYHKKLDSEYDDLNELLTEVESFSMNEYTLALAKGDQLSEEERSVIIDKLHAYTGLSKTYIDNSNLRLYVGRFNKELLRGEGKTVGRLDSRFTGYDYDEAGERYEYDPSYNSAIFGPYTAAINDYLRRELGFKTDITYEILTGRVRPWSYSNVENRYLNVSETLRESMTKNPFLKVWIANGYYDMATAYFATRYTIDHMFLKPQFKKNISLTYYQAGHMMYIHRPSLEQFKKDFDLFIESAK